MITRKALKDKLQQMNPDQVLFDGNRRSYRYDGSREYATLTVLGKLLDLPAVGQSNHSTKRGVMTKNPKWLTQLFADITWSVGDIKTGDILHALCA